MLGASTLVGSSGDGGTSAHEGGGSGGGGEVQTSNMTEIGDDEKIQSSGGGDLFEGDRSTGGNRWPRQETLALLKIRSDMDVTFRDSSLKGPLWEEVSRKMAELGYHRSAKKCKEKFENVYKYHKRTKGGRVGKADGKTYRFFDQLQALEQHHLSSSSLSPLPQPSVQVTPCGESQAPAQAAVPVTMVIPAGTVTVPSSSVPVSMAHTTSITTPPQQQINVNPTVQLQSPLPQVTQQQHHHVTHSSIQMENQSSPSATQSSSSSTSSDEELLGRRKRKRKWKDFFESLMREVIDKQELLQKRFLEAVEKREHDRVAREEAWKMQEMARLNREHDILVQERSMAAAKDAALIAFLQKLSDQQQIPLTLPVQVQAQAQAQAQGQARARAATPLVATPTTPPAQLQNQSQPKPQPQPQQKNLQPLKSQSQSQSQLQQQPQINVLESPLPLPSPAQPQPLTPLPQQTPPHLQQALVLANTNNGDNVDLEKANNGDNLLQASSSRWPKAEVEALINLRTNLDQKYQENGPKGPLWEEISEAMKCLGYNRNAKRCKEKWENINKYFKKVKESNKKRPEDSKTCPYFHQLDALYKGKNKMETTNPPFGNPSMPTYGQPQLKHEGSISASMAPIMAEPEQQWPPIHTHPEQTMEDQESENQDDSEDDGDEEDDDDQGTVYEIVANNNNVNAGSVFTTTTSSRAATAE